MKPIKFRLKSFVRYDFYYEKYREKLEEVYFGQELVRFFNENYKDKFNQKSYAPFKVPGSIPLPNIIFSLSCSSATSKFLLTVLLHFTFATFLTGQTKQFNPPDEKKLSSVVTVEYDAFTSDDSTSVNRYAAILKNNGAPIDTQYSGDNNKVVFTFVPDDVRGGEHQDLNFVLQQNFPNPFNPHTTIQYSLKEASDVKLEVYDIKGELVRILDEGEKGPGQYSVQWNARNNRGQDVSDGVYIYRLLAGDQQFVKKMVYMKGSVPSSCGSSFHKQGSENTVQSDNYTVDFVSNPDSTRPLFNDVVVPLEVLQDTSIDVYLERYLRGASIGDISDLEMNEDEPLPSGETVADLWQNAVGYDSLGNEVPDSLLTFEIEESNPDLVNLLLMENRYIKFDSLATDGNGTSHVTYRVTAPNGEMAEKSFDVIVNEMRDLYGRVDSLFGEGSVNNVIVQYGSYGDTSDSGGNFSMQVPPDYNQQRLVFTKDGFYKSKTIPFKPSVDTVVNRAIADTSLNMEFFDETSRAWNGKTQRWTTQPIFYININPAPEPGGDSTEVSQAEIDTAMSVIYGLHEFTDGYISENPQIIIGTDPPDYGADDTIRIEWDNTLNVNVLGIHAEYLDGNRIKSAAVKMRTGQLRAIPAQEISQTMGVRADSNLEISVFNDGSVFPQDFYTAHDLKVGKFLYNRNFRNTTPDTDNNSPGGK